MTMDQVKCAERALMEAAVTWEDGTNPEIICNHYGYAVHEKAQGDHRGYWPKETVMERIALLPEFIQRMGLEKKKFRAILDYDPEFPRALIQINADKSKPETSLHLNLTGNGSDANSSAE